MVSIYTFRILAIKMLYFIARILNTFVKKQTNNVFTLLIVDIVVCSLSCIQIRSVYSYTLSGQKYLYTAKYPCTDCAIYRLKNQFGAKMGIEIHGYQKFIVLALTLVKIFDFLTFHEVLIY